MKKRWLMAALAMLAVLAFCVPALADESGDCGEDVHWRFDSETGVLTIYGSGAMEDYSVEPGVSGPWPSEVEAVVIEYGVTHVGSSAFSDSAMTRVDMPHSLVSIGMGAFRGCENLRYVSIPSSVETIDDGAFFACTSLSEVTLPQGLSSIGGWMFGFDEMLSSVIIPYTVSEIEDAAFIGCDVLTDVYFTGQSAQWRAISVGEDNEPLGRAIIHCGDLTFGSCGENVTWTLSTAGELTISGEGATVDYSEQNPHPWPNEITSASVSEGITRLGSRLFYHCESMTEVSLPSSLTEIGDEAFRMCGGLTALDIPAEVVTIGRFAFGSCENVTYLAIPDGVRNIEEYTFYQCVRMKEVDLPNELDSLGMAAFYGCHGLVEIVLPAGLTRIEDYTFIFCSNLARIYIPSSVTYIGDQAFSVCDALEHIYFGGTELEWLKVSIAGDNDILREAEIHYAQVVARIVLPECLDSIGAEAFEGVQATFVIVPKGCASIGDRAFRNCTRLTRIRVPSSVTSFGEDVFSGCGTVYVFGPEGSEAEAYCQAHAGCVFIAE